MFQQRKFISASLLALALAAPAAAQDTGANPSYGQVNLDAGFTPDPHRVSLSAGGSVDASNIGSPCTGMVANAPDVRLVYSSGSLPLIISVNSDYDTTLVVNAPDGLWYCDDDSGEGVNPSVRFNKPMSGRYEIWVGTYSAGEYRQATLDISELYSQ
jgi:hypothetical protein